MIEILNANPEGQIFDALVGLRSSFVVPVRGIIAERFSRSSIVLLSDLLAS